jgi:hypothetical protein
MSRKLRFFKLGLYRLLSREIRTAGTAPSVVVLANASKHEKTGRTMGDEIRELHTFEKAVDDAFKTLGEKVEQ